jgi:sugar phosphate isomerase/epimerase
MKLGCACWTFSKGRFLPPYEPTIEIIGDLGFDGIEFILRHPDDLNDYWTEQRIGELRRLCEARGLTISQFALFQDVVADLPSLDRTANARALDQFEQGAKLAAAMGSPLVNFVSQWPVGIQAPAAYVPRYWYINNPGLEGFSPKLSMQLPEPFEWEEIWENYVKTVRTCAEIAAAHGLKLAIEGHAHVVVPNTDSFLRLWDHVQHPALGYNLDTAWLFIQREYIPWSIAKVKGKLLHVHMRDGDGLHAYNLPPGEGILDWEGIFEALRGIGYDGFVSFELGGLSDPVRWVGRAQSYLAEYL